METTRYIYDTNSQLIGEFVLNSNGTPNEKTALTTEYVYLGDMPLAVIKRNNKTDSISWIVADHLNSPKFVINKNYGLNWKWNTEPFGSTLPIETNGFKMNLRFPGQVYDKETGTHYNVFRDYDPQSGRYLQTDPIGLSGGMNRWGYVVGNPLKYTDPLGLEKWIMFDPNNPNDNNIRNYARSIPDNPNELMIIHHGNPSGFHAYEKDGKVYASDNLKDLKEFADKINKSGHKTVRWGACETGQNLGVDTQGNKIENISDKLYPFLNSDINFLSPTTYVYYSANGSYSIHNTKGNPGKWILRKAKTCTYIDFRHVCF